jgi:hypothetical protein
LLRGAAYAHNIYPLEVGSQSVCNTTIMD